jgi:hypothetical protein
MPRVAREGRCGEDAVSEDAVSGLGEDAVSGLHIDS